MKLETQNPDYEISNNDKTLTYRTGEQPLMTTLSGLTSGITEAQLASGIVVNTTDKTLTLSADVLKGTTRVTASGEYTLALDDEIRTAAGTAKNFWQVASDGSAYYRNAKQDYYTVDGTSTIVYHDADINSTAVAFKGLKAGITANNDGEIVDANNNIVVSIDGKTVTVNAAALANSGEIKITAGGTNGYKLALDTEAAMETTPSYTYDPSKGEIIVKATYGAGYIVSADGQTITKITTGAGGNSEQTLATIKGLKTFATTAPTDSEIKEKITFDAVDKVFTFNDDSLFKANMSASDKVEVSSDFFGYKLAVDTNNVSTSTAEKDMWVNNSGTLEYRNVTPAHYTVAPDKKSITYSATKNTDDADTAILAKIEGLKSSLTWAEGTANTAFSIVDTSGNVTTEDAVSIGTGNKITLKLAALPTAVSGRNTTADITLTNSTATGATQYTLALDPTDDNIKTTAEQSDYKWNQAVNATSATITADSTAQYVLASNSETITFTPAKEDATVATISGIKAVNDAITGSELDNMGSATIGNGVNVDVVAKTIYLKDNALNNKDVTVSDDGNFKLELADIQNTAASDIWTINNGTARFVNATPEHYAVEGDNSDTIKYSALDDTKTYFTITGLNNSPAADSKLSTKDDGLGGKMIVKGDGDTAVVTFDGDSTITVRKDALPAPSANVNVVIAKGDNDADTTYKLALDSRMTATTFEKDEDGKETTEVDVPGLAVEGTKAFSVSSGRVVYSAPVKAGYTIDGNGAIKYVDGTKPKEYFTISGLSLPSTLPAGTASWDDYFAGHITVGADNTVTIDSTVLGTNANTKVTVSGNAYKLALADSVPTADTVTESYNWSKSGNNYVYKNSMPAYYTLDTTKNEISYTEPSAGTTYATVTGLKSDFNLTSDAPVVDEVSKTITLTSDHLGNSQVAFSGSFDYKFALSVSDPTFANKWTYTANNTSGTATLKNTASGNKYELTDNDKKVKYTSKDSLSETIVNITGLKTGLDCNESTGITGVTYAPANSEVTLTADVLGTSNISISGSGNAKLVLDATDANIKKTEADASKAWTYSEPKVGNVETPNSHSTEAATTNSTQPTKPLPIAHPARLMYQSAARLQTSTTQLKTLSRLTNRLLQRKRILRLT